MFAQHAEHHRSIPGAVATIGVNDRVTFLRQTYAHLFGAILVFAGLEYLLLKPGSPLFEAISVPMLEMLFKSRHMWLLFLGLFVVTSMIADKFARSDTSRAMQYLGLGLYVFIEAIIFIPILWVASTYYPGVIADAAIVTLIMFAGLTATVFLTRKDFSFLRSALTLGMFGAMAIIVASLLFGFDLGPIFSGVMILLACGYILYDTSQIMAHYRPTQYVAASLALFASVALLFWYVLRLLMSLRD